MKPFISIIVTTKNEEKNIENCIKSIKTQTYPEDLIEVIVVDNNSTDRTKEIVKNFKLSNLKTFKPSNMQLYSQGPERSTQRNFGISKAKGEYILFLDADMSLSEGVIAECVNKFTSSRVKELVGLYIPEKILGDSFWCKVRDFERSFYDGTVIDAVRFFPKKIWQEVKGFDENLTGPEDWDFDKKLRLKGKVDIIQSSLFHNEQGFNLKEYLKGKSYYSKSIPKYIQKWGKHDTDITKQLGPYYRLLGVFVEKGKWKKLISHPDLAIGMYFIRFIVGLGYLRNKNKIINIIISL